MPTPTFQMVPPHTDKLWIVHIHFDAVREKVFSVGYCDMQTFGSGAPWKKSAQWQAYAATVPPDQHVVSCEIFTGISAALTRARELFKLHTIPFELQITPPVLSTRKHVTCLQTGVDFPTATAAAHWIGCTPAQMSLHLNRKPGYQAIRGHEFIWNESVPPGRGA